MEKVVSISVLACLVICPVLGSCGGGGNGEGDGPPTTVTVADMTGLRKIGANPVIMLSFCAVKTGTEDRTIIHFSITGLPGSPASATLYLPLQNIDAGPGQLLVYEFAGDGVVSTDEWNLGTNFHHFWGIAGGTSTLTLDVTALIAAAVTAGDNYVSLNLRGVDDRYNLSDFGSVPDPYIALTW